MAKVSKTVAALRIFGDTLDPDEVSILLGVKPSTSHRKGEVVRSAKAERQIIRKSGMWILEADDRVPGDLDGQIQELLGKLPNDLSVLTELSERFQIDIFSGFFMQEGNEGLSLKASTLLALGSRGIELELDIYDSSD